MKEAFCTNILKKYIYLFNHLNIHSIIQEWEIVEKEQPDGTKKRFRRRIITVTTTTTFMTTRYVVQGDPEDENVMESKPLQTMTFDIVDGKPVGYALTFLHIHFYSIELEYSFCVCLRLTTSVSLGTMCSLFSLLFSLSCLT